MTRSQQKRLVSLLGFLFALGVYYLQHQYLGQSDAASANSEDQTMMTTSSPAISDATTTNVLQNQIVTTTNALVIKVIDGDTIEALRDGEREPVKIRLLAVNTPETVDPRKPVECYGKEASVFAKQQLSHQRIRLVEDPQADNIDKYGRFLRFVIKEDGTNFNQELVQQGYAYAYLSFPLNESFKALFRRLETEARLAKRGLWNPDTCGGEK